MSPSGCRGDLASPEQNSSRSVNRLHAASVKALAKPEFRKKLVEMGAEPAGTTPEQFAALIQKETASWAKLVKSTGVQLD